MIGRQYWFIYTILGIYLIAPLFWTKKEEAANSNTTVMFIISYVIICTITIFDISLPELFQVDHIINYLPYFVFGCVLRQKERQVISTVSKINKTISVSIALFLVFAFLITYISYPAIRNYPIRFLVALLMFYLIYELTKGFRAGISVLEMISKYSLQVMFLDGIIRTVIFVILNKVGIISIVTTLITVLLVISLSILACKIIEKIPILNRLTGL